MNDDLWSEHIPDYARSDGAVEYYEYTSVPRAQVESTFVTPRPLVVEEHSSIASGALQPARQPRNRLVYSIIGILSVVVVILAGSAVYFYTRPLPSSSSVIRQPTPAPINITSAFHYAACPFTPGTGIIEGQELKCGFLTVPEDRSHAGGSTIQLAVAIFKASSLHPPTDPEIYLTGGPGGALLDDLGTYITSDNLDKLTLGHDLILLDQRGTGYSRPLLTCPELTNFNATAANEQMTVDQAHMLYLQAAQACHDRLTNAGINLQTFTTIDNATDVHDLIHALGYKQVNLYGVSYGTRLALTVMRLFPTDIRSVVLDSTVPTQLNLFNTEPYVIQHAFDTLFQGCAASLKCKFAYPLLQNVFYQLVTHLNARPGAFQDDQQGTVRLDGTGLVDFLFSAMYVTSLIPLLPEIITQISKGDYTLLAKYFDRLTGDRGISDAMYFSVECGEDMAFTTRQELDSAANILRPEIRPGVLSSLQDDFTICQHWSEHAVPTKQKQPVISSIPTLILSGEYDPITPSSNAKLAMRTLSNSFFFLFPATGHGVFYTNSCPDSIITAFLAHPDEKPAGDCIAKMQEPDFQ
jgi:pimeloyl-ACP methyl ester carboxylesterase